MSLSGLLKSVETARSAFRYKSTSSMPGKEPYTFPPLILPPAAIIAWAVPWSVPRLPFSRTRRPKSVWVASKGHSVKAMVSGLFIQDTILGVMKSKVSATCYLKLMGFCCVVSFPRLEQHLLTGLIHGLLPHANISVGHRVNDNYLYTRSAIH